MLCGTDPLPELYRAKKYKLHQRFISKAEFQFIMRNLPVRVAEQDIEVGSQPAMQVFYT